MAKAFIHSKSSAKKYGGNWEEYMDIHELMDSSKSVISDNRHRTLTHHSWFIGQILPKIFTETRKLSSRKIISIRDIGEQHCLEDFGMRYIPTAEDYLKELNIIITDLNLDIIDHASKSVELFGGNIVDYIEIHKLLDNPKMCLNDNRSIILTHNTWFLEVILPKIFTDIMLNSDNNLISVRKIAQEHIKNNLNLNYIPSAQHWIENVEFMGWMDNGRSGYPYSFKKIQEKIDNSKEKVKFLTD